MKYHIHSNPNLTTYKYDQRLVHLLENKIILDIQSPKSTSKYIIDISFISAKVLYLLLAIFKYEMKIKKDKHKIQ